MDRVKLVLTQSYLASFIFVQALFFNYWWIIVSVYVYILTKALSIRYLPPFALILGASGTETNNLVKMVQSAARPLAARELLQVKMNLLRDTHVATTSFRIANAFINWEAFVELYCTVSKLVVIDIENITDAIDVELSTIDQHDLWHKVIFFTPSESAHVHRILRQYPSAQVACVTGDLDALARTIKYVAGNPKRMPSKTNPLHLARL
jgi:hypothetical protein